MKRSHDQGEKSNFCFDEINSKEIRTNGEMYLYSTTDPDYQ